MRFSPERWCWSRRPVVAVTSPDALLEDMEYDTVIYYRLLSHALVRLVLGALTQIHVLFVPAVVGLLSTSPPMSSGT